MFQYVKRGDRIDGPKGTNENIRICLITDLWSNLSSEQYLALVASMVFDDFSKSIRIIDNCLWFFVCCIYEFHAFSIIISLVWMDL
ncbi:hypothetical protein BpHYR1_006922 [Brachionus plicatilis]|uniref:Uncharacterized protein n=1 Tax=Brachionus plicatilis TaxID=10195 RepID=A0A3M7QRW0_BRAPC|nr:hypothetical protein BpHYR1_006922 [Brachionus plicatilis]